MKTLLTTILTNKKCHVQHHPQTAQWPYRHQRNFIFLLRATHTFSRTYFNCFRPKLNSSKSPLNFIVVTRLRTSHVWAYISNGVNQARAVPPARSNGLLTIRFAQCGSTKPHVRHLSLTLGLPRRPTHTHTQTHTMVPSRRTRTSCTYTRSAARTFKRIDIKTWPSNMNTIQCER